jgi:hypothetical protein
MVPRSEVAPAGKTSANIGKHHRLDGHQRREPVPAADDRAVHHGYADDRLPELI